MVWISIFTLRRNKNLRTHNYRHRHTHTVSTRVPVVRCYMLHKILKALPVICGLKNAACSPRLYWHRSMKYRSDIIWNFLLGATRERDRKTTYFLQAQSVKWTAAQTGITFSSSHAGCFGHGLYRGSISSDWRRQSHPICLDSNAFIISG